MSNFFRLRCKRLGLAISISLVFFCFPAKHSLFAGTPNSATKISKSTPKIELYLRFAREISRSVAYGIGPPASEYRRFSDAIKFGSASCGYYVEEMLQRLAREGIQADILATSSPGGLVGHALVTVDDAVIDPTFGVVYPYPLDRILGDPQLANTFIGERPSEVSRAYIGETFFSTINTIIRRPLPSYTNVQQQASIRVETGYVSPDAIPYWINGDLNVPAAGYWNQHGSVATVGTAEDAIFSLTWSKPIFARSVTIVPGWLDGAITQQMFVRVYSEGKLAYAGERNTSRVIGGSYGVTIPNDIKIDKMEIALDAADAEEKPLILSEIIIDGWPANTEN